MAPTLAPAFRLFFTPYAAFLPKVLAPTLIPTLEAIPSIAPITAPLAAALFLILLIASSLSKTSLTPASSNFNPLSKTSFCKSSAKVNPVSNVTPAPAKAPKAVPRIGTAEPPKPPTAAPAKTVGFNIALTEETNSCPMVLGLAATPFTHPHAPPPFSA